MILSQYYEEVFGCYGACCDATPPLALKFRWSIESPPLVPRSGNGRGDGDVSPLLEPSPALEAEGAAGDGT